MRLLLRLLWLCALLASVAGWWQLGLPFLQWQGGRPAALPLPRLAQQAPAGSLAVLGWSAVGLPSGSGQAVQRWIAAQYPSAPLKFDEFRASHTGESGYAALSVSNLGAAQRALSLWLAVPAASLPVPLPGLGWTVGLQSSDQLRIERELNGAADALTRKRVGRCWLFEGKEGQPSYGLGDGMVWVGSSALGVQACLESVAHPADSFAATNPGRAALQQSSAVTPWLCALNPEAVAPLLTGHPADTLPLPEMVPLNAVHSVTLNITGDRPLTGELFAEAAFKPRENSLPLMAATLVPRSWLRCLSLRPSNWGLQLASKLTGLDSTVLAGWGIEEIALALPDRNPAHTIVLLRPRFFESARNRLLPMSRSNEGVDARVHEAFHWNRSRGRADTICWWAALPGKQPVLAFQATPELSAEFLTLLNGTPEPWAPATRQGTERWAAELHQNLEPGSGFEPWLGERGVLHAQVVPEAQGLRLVFSVAAAEVKP